MEKLSGVELELDIWFGIRNQFLIELPRLETEIESLTNELYVNWLKSFNGYFSEAYTVSEESDVTDYERSYLSDSDESFAADDDDDDEDLTDLVLGVWLKFVEKEPVTSVTVRNQFLTESSRLETEIEDPTNELYVDWLKSFDAYFSDSDDETEDEDIESEEYSVTESEESDDTDDDDDDESGASSDSDDEAVDGDDIEDVVYYCFKLLLNFLGIR